MRQLLDMGITMSDGFQRRQRDAIRLWFSPMKGEGDWNGNGNGNENTHVSSLRIDQLLKKKILFRRRRSPSMRRYLEEAYQFGLKEGIETDTFISPPLEGRKRARLSEITFKPHSHTERRILPTGGIQVTRTPTCNECPHPGETCNFLQYILPKSSPPTPPRRSSSLLKDSRAIECIPSPSAPLTPFSLSPEDGYFFQFMINGSLSKLDFFSKPNLWPMVIQRFHTEPCVRHILLGTAMIHRQRVHPHTSQHGNTERRANRHYIQATRLFHPSLSNIRGRLHGEMREITILTTFLLAAFEILRRDDERASYWVENGMKILGRPNPNNASETTSRKKTRMAKVQWDRNSKQLAQAFQILDVNLKIKRMKRNKKKQRSAGRCGGGVLSRKRLEKKRSCVGLFSS
ncbi:hypothetical protein HYALB_00004681 [Hymenoscyphus albidus]|uniref:Uncharacterized protein n=1 Tax=Hymenoscyphus albidus TaxID=595503 RepID=A0A9N9LQH8_9HELO|nr:hypothetical protein HYALB_00004681 [Hymenoscyphus albidus]